MARKKVKSDARENLISLYIGVVLCIRRVSRNPLAMKSDPDARLRYSTRHGRSDAYSIFTGPGAAEADYD